MVYRRTRRSHRRGSRNGLDAARKHIEEAKQLSEELGGTDKDVKAYFFGLDSSTLKRVLDLYEQHEGLRAREYAENTLPRWRSGKVQMSGLVATRLFRLLPQLMPVEKKFELVKTLWKNKCPTSRLKLYIGPNADSNEVCKRVREHLENTVKDYYIPESITKRFKWLAKDNVTLQEKLYNYFLQLNREAVTQASGHRLPQLLDNLQARDETIHEISQSLTVGNHHVTVVFHSKASGISTARPVIPPVTSTARPVIPPVKSGSANDSSGCLILLIITMVILAFAILS